MLKDLIIFRNIKVNIVYECSGPIPIFNLRSKIYLLKHASLYVLEGALISVITFMQLSISSTLNHSIILWAK